MHLRLASLADVAELRRLIETSVRSLQTGDYNPRQIELALATVYGVDTRLIADETYFAVEAAPGGALAACGGWSQRRTLYGGDQYGGRDDDLLDPELEPAKIRAFFVLPEYVRRGLGSQILAACEGAARAAGFGALELGATLSGVAFYRARGYSALESLAVPLGRGEWLPIVRMGKTLPPG